VEIGILGAGIDGLLAAHAAVQSGHHVVIYADEEQPYVICGARAHLVERDIPYITDSFEQAVLIAIRPQDKVADSIQALDFHEAYRAKVFGPEDAEFYMDGFMLTELSDCSSLIKAYNAQNVYSTLFEIYSSHIHYQWVTPKWYAKTNVRHDHDIIINTLDGEKWCIGNERREKSHIFSRSFFWYTNYAPFGPVQQNVILLDASDDVQHYLQANLFGKWIVEWPHDKRPPPLDSLYIGTRPLGTDCDCQKTYDFINIGQMAQWNHSKKIHDSYYNTIDFIEQYQMPPIQLDLGI